MAATAIPPVRITVSAILQQHRADVNRFIEEEVLKIDGPTCENIQTAIPVGLAVDNLSNIWNYYERLTKTAEELDQVAAKKLEQLKTLVADLKSREPMVLVNLRTRAVYFSESIIRDKWQPIVTGLARSYIYPSDNFEITILGRFRYIAQYFKKYPEVCSFTFSDQLVPLADANESGLTFRVNNFVLKGKTPESALKKCFLFNGSLTLKYTVTTMTSYSTASFSIGIPAFPTRPGDITLTRFVCEITKQQKQLFSSQLILTRKPQEGDKAIVREMSILPTPGWRMVSKPKLTSSGETKELESAGGCVNVNLKLEEGKERVEAEIAFEEENDVYEEVKKVGQVQLLWNQSYEFQALKFQVDVASFDGQKFIIDKPYDPKEKKVSFVKVVQKEEGKYQLIAVPLN